MTSCASLSPLQTVRANHYLPSFRLETLEELTHLQKDFFFALCPYKCRTASFRRCYELADVSVPLLTPPLSRAFVYLRTLFLMLKWLFCQLVSLRVQNEVNTHALTRSIYKQCRYATCDKRQAQSVVADFFLLKYYRAFLRMHGGEVTCLSALFSACFSCHQTT